MRILSLNLEDANGLSNIKMKRLDKIVLIAGKNGSGKSRLLEEINNNIKKKETKLYLEKIKKDIAQIESDIYSLNSAIPSYKQNIIKVNREINGLTNGSVHYTYNKTTRLQDLRSQLTQHERSLKNSEEFKIQHEESLIKNKLLVNEHSFTIETDDLYENYEIVNFVPQSLHLVDPSTKSQMEIDSVIHNQDKGFKNSNQTTFSIIQDITNKWIRATHQTLKTTEEFNIHTITQYNRLKEHINIFLDTELGFDEEKGISTLFGLKLGESKLSNGQKILLQLCIGIFTQENELEKTVIFMDEPENHLHPKALIDVINKLSEIITDGQIWISTHSINLLANYDPKNIWYMENGNIQHAGKIPEKVLESLLGEKDNISKLENFISLPSQMATNNFAFECLFYPIQVETGVDDPQVGQIIEAIKNKYTHTGKVKVLDFGAGKGRLLSTIDEISHSKNIPTIDWLDYYAYDIPSPNKQKCIGILNNIYDKGTSRYFDNKSTFRDNIEENSFDLIVLSNVFHEIDPKCWNDEFGTTSLISFALKEDGILLIIEDQLIPIGEKAYQNGFLVFDKEQFKKLFKIKEYEVKSERDGRLKAHFIKKEFLQNMTLNSKKEAIESLETRAKEKVIEIRSDNPSYENGKLHAFWTQQLANSYLARSQL